jgi:hypothetical protein
VASSEAEARKLARHWLRALGIDPDDLAKQYPQLAAGTSGRRKHPPVPHQMLTGIELFVRVVRRDYDGRNKPKMTRKNAIQWFAEAAYYFVGVFFRPLRITQVSYLPHGVERC